MESIDRPADEAVLRDFFRAELGPDLPPLPVAEVGRGVSRNRRWLGLAVGLAATVALFVVWGMLTSGTETERLDRQEFMVTESSRPIERITYPTADGVVAQETTIKWTTIALTEPESGDCIQWSIPEVSIVVQPAGTRPPKESKER